MDVVDKVIYGILEERRKKKKKGKSKGGGGLWANIQARRRAKKPRLKPGHPNYPKTLKISEGDACPPQLGFNAEAEEVSKARLKKAHQIGKSIAKSKGKGVKEPYAVGMAVAKKMKRVEGFNGMNKDAQFAESVELTLADLRALVREALIELV